MVPLFSQTECTDAALLDTTPDPGSNVSHCQGLLSTHLGNYAQFPPPYGTAAISRQGNAPPTASPLEIHPPAAETSVGLATAAFGISNDVTISILNTKWLLLRSGMAVPEKQSTLLDVNVSEDISASIFKVESVWYARIL